MRPIAAAQPPAIDAQRPTDRVVVVGAGPAGMATAIELAQHGVPSVVLEKRGEIATRAPLFAVMPPFADRLAALDPEGSLTRLLTPIDDMRSAPAQGGARAKREFTSPVSPDAGRSRGDIDAIVRAAGPPGAAGADPRRWAFAGIDDVDNGLRALARSAYPDLIELMTDTEVTAIRQGDGWAEAVLAPSGDAAAADAIRGAILIDASGRDLLRGPRTTDPVQVHWLGGRFPAPPDGSHTLTKVRTPAPDGGHGHATTVALPGGDRTIVWTQVTDDPRRLEPEAARALVQDRARAVGVSDPLPAGSGTIPVTVQLWTSDEPAIGRVLKVGDSVRAPYFMTSTGAATALVHDAPRAVDAVLAVRRGTPVAHAIGAYADSVRGANARLMELVRPRLHADAAAIRGR